MSPLPIFAIPSSAAPPTSAELWRDAVVAASGTVSGGRLTLVSNLIEGLKADSVWTLLDRLWLHAGENTQSALIDLVARATATVVSTPTFTADRGYTTSGTAYVNLGTPGGTNYVLNNAMFGFAKRTNNGVDTIISMGTTNTNGVVISYLAPKFSDTFCYGGVNVQFAPATTGFSDTSGNFLVARTAASGAGSTQVYRNGSSAISMSDASNGIPNQSFVVGGYLDSTGTFSNGGSSNTQQFSASYIGAITDPTMIGNFDTRLQTYLTAVGA